jgi:FMN phosphatase YigB (HAD superfamily)
MFFDDNFSNIESAKRVGVQAILIDPISSLSQIRQILQAYVN